MVETTVIIDIIVAAVLLAFVILGARRGLFRSVAGLAILVVSLVGANMAADSLTPMAAGIMQPAIENRVEEKLGEVLPEDMELPEAEDTAMGELLALLGIDADPAEEILERAGEQVRRNGAGAVAAVAVGVAESTIHVAVFLLVFLAAFIVLKLLAHLVDLTLKLPVLSGANALGGGHHAASLFYDQHAPGRAGADIRDGPGISGVAVFDSGGIQCSLRFVPNAKRMWPWSSSPGWMAAAIPSTRACA